MRQRTLPHRLVKTSASIKYKRQRAVGKEDASMYELLSGQHICLRKAKETDYKSMLKHVWGNESVFRWMLFQPTHTEADALDRCRRSILFQKDNYAYFIALKDTDEAIGMCAIRESDPGHYEECGICIGTAYQGKGYGKETVSLLLELAFEELHAEDFRYGFFHENERSKHLAEHFGFQYDSSYEMIRPWDGRLKTVDSCLLTRENYMASGKSGPVRSQRS